MRESLEDFYAYICDSCEGFAYHSYWLRNSSCIAFCWRYLEHIRLHWFVFFFEMTLSMYICIKYFITIYFLPQQLQLLLRKSNFFLISSDQLKLLRTLEVTAWLVLELIKILLPPGIHPIKSVILEVSEEKSRLWWKGLQRNASLVFLIF